MATPSTFELLVTATDGTLSQTVPVTIYVGTTPVTNATRVESLLSGTGGVFEGDSNPAIIGAGADPDHDGTINLFELWAGSDPSAPDGLPFPAFGQQRIEYSSYRTVEMTVSKAMDDALLVGADISSDLESWRPAEREVLYEIGSMRTIRFRDTLPTIAVGGSIPRTFVRFTADFDAVK